MSGEISKKMDTLGLNRLYTKTIGVAILSTTLIIMGCSPTNKDSKEGGGQVSDKDPRQVAAEVFGGCYTVTPNTPAQIKISQLDDGNLMMQMKEPSTAGRLWDTPEPLELLPLTEVPNFFSIDSEHVNSLIARPDKLFAIGHVNEAYATMDPLLDSEYLGFILQGANTIFKVACDSVYSDGKTAQ